MATRAAGCDEGTGAWFDGRPMPPRLASPRQRALFDAVARCGPLVFACGPRGISANLVGEIRLARHGTEDRFDAGDGTHHVHVDWARVRRAEIGVTDDEGVVTAFDGEDVLFKVYRPAGPYPADVISLGGDLSRTT